MNILTVYNFCYERASDLISFPVDLKLKSINENVKYIENRPRNNGCNDA